MRKLAIIFSIPIFILSGLVVILLIKNTGDLGASVKILNETYAKGQSDLANEIVDLVTKEQKLIIPIDGKEVTFVPETTVEPIHIEPTVSENISE